MAATYGFKRVVFGITDRLPIRGFPPGKIRIRQRRDDFLRAFVRDESGITAYWVMENKGFWEPFGLIARNLTFTNQ